MGQFQSSPIHVAAVVPRCGIGSIRPARELQSVLAGSALIVVALGIENLEGLCKEEHLLLDVGVCICQCTLIEVQIHVRLLASVVLH